MDEAFGDAARAPDQGARFEPIDQDRDVRWCHRERARAEGEIRTLLSQLLTEESALLKRTVVTNGLVSFVAVTLLFWICYRRVAALVYSSVPLLLGQAVTFAVAEPVEPPLQSTLVLLIVTWL